MSAHSSAGIFGAPNTHVLAAPLVQSPHTTPTDKISNIYPQVHPQQINFIVAGDVPMASRVLSHTIWYSAKIDIVWFICVLCTLILVFSSVWSVVRAPAFNEEMLLVPYQCKLFYFGLFCGLPGITVLILCLSLIFHQLCKSGVLLSLLSTFLMIVTIEHACMTAPTISVDQTFNLMGFSVYIGLISHGVYIAILYNESNQKQFYDDDCFYYFQK